MYLAIIEPIHLPKQRAPRADGFPNVRLTREMSRASRRQNRAVPLQVLAPFRC
jgi:hypothetical protein